MEAEVRKLLAGLSPEAEAAVKQALLLFAARIIEAVTRNGSDNNNTQRR